MKTKSITDENLELLKQFKNLSRAYDVLATAKTTCFIRICAEGYYFEFDLTQKEVDSIVNKKLKELAVQIEKM